MRHSPAKVIQDLLDAAEAICSFVEGKTLNDFRKDLLLRSGVERQFEIVGEALRRLVKVDPALAQMVEDFPKIVAFRNIIAHGYDVLDPAITWDVALNDLPRLRQCARKMLADLTR